MTYSLRLPELQRALSGATPVIIATAAADGTPNVTYLSRTHPVDDEHIALSNQFFSKTTSNLNENPHASIAVVDPATGASYRLALTFRHTETDGPVYEQLKADVAVVAAMTGMDDVFRLRGADIYQVTAIERLYIGAPDAQAHSSAILQAVAALGAQIAACTTLDELVDETLRSIDERLGHRHTAVYLLNEDATSLYAVASRGFDTQGVGAEIPVGDGVIGMCAAQSAPIRVGNLRIMAKYSRALRRGWEHEVAPSERRHVPLPRLAGAESRMAVPLIAFGRLIGVLTAEALISVAFGPDDEAALNAIAAQLAPAFDALRASELADDILGDVIDELPQSLPPAMISPDRDDPLHVRHYEADGSTFLNGDYLIKGVAGRILWSILTEHRLHGRVEFTNRELRLDPTLGMPGFKDNLESRLLALRRRLEERDAPIRLVSAGRGRLHLTVTTGVELESATP